MRCRSWQKGGSGDQKIMYAGLPLAQHFSEKEGGGGGGGGGVALIFGSVWLNGGIWYIL